MSRLVEAHSADPEADLQRILGAAAVNWFIGGTDAHAKNYSWFLTSGDQILMTPLYDLISALPYYPVDNQLRMAMPIGGETVSSTCAGPSGNVLPTSSVRIPHKSWATCERSCITYRPR